MTINSRTAYMAELRRRENVFLRGRNQTVVEFSNPVDPDALEWIERQFKQFPVNLSFQSAEAEGIEFPISPDEAKKALKLLQKEDRRVSAKVSEFNRIKDEINNLVAELYQTRKI